MKNITKLLAIVVIVGMVFMTGIGVETSDSEAVTAVTYKSLVSGSMVKVVSAEDPRPGEPDDGG